MRGDSLQKHPTKTDELDSNPKTLCYLLIKCNMIVNDNRVSFKDDN